MRKLLVICTAAISAAAFAGSAGAEGTDFVVSEDSGLTYTYNTAIGNYSRLVKRGAGEVELTVAANGFAGTVVVEAGTLTIKDKDAVGSGTPVTVVSGATLHLKLPGLGQGSTAFPHVVTIAGKGVGNNGALRFSNTTSSYYGDNLLTKLVLSDDATIECTYRWGLFFNDLDLAGHTLTRIGSSTWMICGAHITAGKILNTAGNMTLQFRPVFDEGLTVSLTNNSDVLSLYGIESGSSIKGTIELNGKTIRADSGVDIDRNHIGNVHLLGDGSFDTSSSGRAISVDGAVTGESGKDLYIYGTGNLFLNGSVTLADELNKNGSGTLWLNGAADIGNTTWFYDGTIAMTSTATRTMYVNVCGNSTAFLSDGTLRFKRLRVTNGSSAGSATFRQTGGTFQDIWGDKPIIGDNPNQRGFFTLEGGIVNFRNTAYLANNVGSYGAFRQTGGMFNVVNAYSSGTLMYIGRNGRALFVQTGGTNDIGFTVNDQTPRAIMGTNSVTTMTVAGTGTVFRTGCFNIGMADGLSTNILNLCNGGTFKANRFWRDVDQMAGSFSCINADGGILMPTYPWGWTRSDYGDASFFNRNPGHFVLWEKGLVIDTSENESMSTYGGGYTSVPFLFDAPTGKGVESVTLPTSGDYTTATYYGIMPIVFEDATGWGASAYAEFDYTTKGFTKVVITSRGCGYSDSAKAYIESPDRSTLYECGLALTSNEGKCGPLVKRGAPELRLYSANTITGGIIVEQGTLRTGVRGVVPAHTPVTVAYGATLDLYNKGDITVSTFAGAGTVSNGSVTVVSAIRATCADLFAGKAATFRNNLSFADGAVFEITDAENLETYKDASKVVALTAGGTISRVPSVRFTTSTGASAVVNGAWSLRLSADGKSLRFGRDKGMVISVR